WEFPYAIRGRRVELRRRLRVLLVRRLRVGISRTDHANRGRLAHWLRLRRLRPARGFEPQISALSRLLQRPDDPQLTLRPQARRALEKIPQNLPLVCARFRLVVAHWQQHSP